MGQTLRCRMRLERIDLSVVRQYDSDIRATVERDVGILVMVPIAAGGDELAPFIPTTAGELRLGPIDAAAAQGWTLRHVFDVDIKPA